MIRWRNESGDTIVEVMIAIAVISLVLVAAYVISNKNVQAIQINEERVQAQHLVEGEIEALRASGGLATGQTCFPVGTVPNVAMPCQQTEAGSGAMYSVTISGPTVNVYKIVVLWTSLSAHTNNNSNVTMYYRLQ